MAQWWSAWLKTEGPQVRASPVSLRCGPWARHIYPSLELVQPRKTHPYITERLLMGRKESNQANKQCSLFRPAHKIFGTFRICVMSSHKHACTATESSGVREINFGLRLCLYLHSYFMCSSSEALENECLHRIVWGFATHICDMLQNFMYSGFAQAWKVLE